MILNGKAKDNFIDYIDSDDLLVEGMSDIHVLKGIIIGVILLFIFTLLFV